MKKRELKNVLTVVLGIVLMSSCAMTKKRYSKGYYIESNKNYVVKDKESKVTELEKERLVYTENTEKIEAQKVESEGRKENLLIASNDSEIFILKPKLILKKKNKVNNVSISNLSFREVKLGKNEVVKKKNIKQDDKVNREDTITVNDGYTLMSFVFALMMFVTPFFMLPTVVFYILGEESKLKWFRRITFVLVYVIFILSLLAFLEFGVWPFYYLLIL
jgi:thiol:disulfide interchange protein